MNKLSCLKRNVFGYLFCLAICLLFSLNVFGQVVQTRPQDQNTSKKTDKQKSGQETKKQPDGKDVDIGALERKAFELLNEHRKKDNMTPLVWNEKLSKVARKHSTEMAKHKFFTIKGYGGKEMPAQVKEFGIIGWTNLGRMIGASGGIADPVNYIVKRWLTSEVRRKYISNKNWSETGVGIARTESGNFFMTQDFLAR